MPTTITGNPTGVASPSLQPDPDTVPVSAAPQDIVDGVNAVTVDQPFQATSNEIAYLKRPTAGIPAAPAGLDVKFVQPIRAARNVRGLRRNFEDHRGFGNLARITQWQEDWSDFAFRTPIVATGLRHAFAKRWTASITPGASTTPQILSSLGSSYLGPGPDQYGGNMLTLDTGNVGGPGNCILCVEENGGTWITDDTDIVFQCETPLGAPGANVEVAMGLIAGPASATGLFASTNPVGVALYTGPGAATHCQLYTCDGTGAGVFHSLGAAGDASTRFRLEYQGVNAADDSTPRVLVYGDGDLTKPLANVALTIPLVTGNHYYLQSFFRLVSQGGRQIARFGAMEFAAARIAGDRAY